MSLTGEEAQRGAREPEADGPEPCGNCGAPMREDQEWCLECGAARTLVHGPPDWRIALAVMTAVAILVLVGFGIALVGLSTSSNRELASATTAARPSSAAAGAPAAGSAPAAGAAPVATAPAARRAAVIASWPVGLAGWTVSLTERTHRARAEAVAHKLAARGMRVGILSSSRHPVMTPGLWVVFAGRYPHAAQARAAAARLRGRGFSHAVGREVAPPGGL